MATGGGSPAGAQDAAEQLVAEGARALLSFGLAGGLDPALRPGALVIPARVIVDGESHTTVSAWLGGANADAILAEPSVVVTATEKRLLWQKTGAVATDLESGAVACVAAAHGLPFAVLRAVCDPAERTLPPAALLALDQAGVIGIARVLRSVFHQPSQIPALLALARDAAAARAALKKAARQLEG